MDAQADLQFGKLAVMKSLISQAQFEECLLLQQRNAAMGLQFSLRELLERKGYLKPADLSVLVQEQEFLSARADDIQFGQIVIDNDFASRKVVRAALDKQTEDWKRLRVVARLGKMLLDQNALNPQQLRAVMKAQDRIRAQTPEPPRTPPVAGTPAPSPVSGIHPRPVTPPSEEDAVATIGELQVPWLQKKPAPAAPAPVAPPTVVHPPSDQDAVSTMGEIQVPWLQKKPAPAAPAPVAPPAVVHPPSDQDAVSTMGEIQVPWLQKKPGAGDKKP